MAQNVNFPRRPTRAAGSRASSGLRTVRLLFLLPGGVALIVGLAAGLANLGILGPEAIERIGGIHPQAMVFGFVGTVIVLERAVAIRKNWAYASPLMLAFGTLIMLTPLPSQVGIAIITGGLLVLLAIYRGVWRRQASVATAVQALGAVGGVTGCVIWIGGVPFGIITPLVSMFLVLTIVGERIELSRIAVLKLRSELAGFALSALTLLAAGATVFWPRTGYLLLGACVLALVVWLLVFDVASKTVRAKGAARFMALCLLSGYAWLAVAAITWLLAPDPFSDPAVDATTHAILLGFVISMIMAHASVIMPAVLRIRLPYRPEFYAALVILQLSLIARVFIGDGRSVDLAVTIGGIGNEVAIILFAIFAIASAVRATRAKNSGSCPTTFHPT